MPHREATLRVWVGGTITTLWAISLIADLFIVHYDPPPSLGTLMLLLAGALYGKEVVGQIRRPPGNNHDQ